MKWFFGFISAASFLVIFLQGKLGLNTLPFDQFALYTVIAWVAFAAFEVLDQLDKVKERIDGLAKRNATQGTYQQGRESTQPKAESNKLEGHWHKAYTKLAPPINAGGWCDWNGYLTGYGKHVLHPEAVSKTCPSRDPRSTR